MTPYFATMFVSACALGNMVGRLFFGPLSDRIGYKRCFDIYLAGSTVACVAIPMAANWITTSAVVGPLAIFYTSAFMLNVFYGGCWAVVVPYQSSIFGPGHVTAIYGASFLGKK